jgi:DNA-binding NarL/FixJ family response regulator
MAASTVAAVALRWHDRGMHTVLIVDDHPSARRAARALLEADGLIVVGEAADGRSALAAVRSMCPSVVLVDIGLPGMDGFAVAAALAADAVGPRVVLMSSRDASVYGDRLANAAAAGFIAKDELTGARLRALLETR